MLSGKIRTLSDDEEDSEDEEDTQYANIDVDAIMQARLRAFRHEKLGEWLEIAAIWGEELEMDVAYNVTVLTATCYREYKQEVEQSSRTEEGSLRVVGAPEEGLQFINTLNGIGSAQADVGGGKNARSGEVTHR